MEVRQGEGVDNNEKKNEDSYENLGLPTGEALEILQRDIKRVIEEYEKESKKNK